MMLRINIPGPCGASTVCYSCTLIESMDDERDHYQGSMGCGDPFDSTDIPHVECNGECGVSSLVAVRDSFVHHKNDGEK